MARIPMLDHWEAGYHKGASDENERIRKRLKELIREWRVREQHCLDAAERGQSRSAAAGEEAYGFCADVLWIALQAAEGKAND